MTNQAKFEKAFNYFKQSYKYKMGGTQTVVLPNGKSKYFDDREYYAGRGSKYNNSIKHDNIGDVLVSKKQYSEFLKKLKETQIRIKEQKALKEARIKAYQEAKENGLYIIENGYVQLLEEEQEGCSFDSLRLANTLKISIEDANLLNSEGKTYVFAKSNNGKIYMLYHASLSCNPLNIHIDEVTEEYVAEFKKSWGDKNAPYAEILGQSEQEGHFVC